MLRLIDDMIETMHEVRGVGLAANQVGVPLPVAVIQVSADEVPTVLINPKMVRRDGEREVVEGCLSIPGYQGTAKRSVRVRAKALDRDGKEFRLRAEDDVMAQAIEHELGHLNGELYIDHLSGDGRLLTLEEAEDDAGGRAAARLKGGKRRGGIRTRPSGGSNERERHDGPGGR